MKVAALFAVLGLASVAAAQTGAGMVHGKDGIVLPSPPVVRTEPVIDHYGSTAAPIAVTDNYRYLEDAKSPDTRTYIGTENAYTQKYFDQVKMLPEVRTQMSALLKVDFLSTPQKRGDTYFFTKRLASENQGSIYMRKGLHGEDVKLIDALALSTDQNTSVSILEIAEDASLMVYGVRVGGADEEEVHFFNLQSKSITPDLLPSARYYGVQLAPDKKGVYYSRFYPHEGSRVFFHAFGATAADDKMLFGRAYRGEALGEIDNIGVRVTANGHYLVLNIGRGVPAKREDILLKDLRVPDSPIVPLVYGIDSRFRELNLGDTFYVDTDYKAPNHRILKAEPGKSPDSWATVIPEGKDVIEGASLVDRKLYVLRLHDVKSELTSYSLDGKATGKIELPGIGAGSDLSGRAEEKDGFYTFQSIISPPTTYFYNTTTGKSEIFNKSVVPFDTASYELKEVFYTSKDGTRVPMFIAGKKGLPRDGSVRLLMTGYGGFALSELPTWNPEYAWWMQQGGWFALPDLRGAMSMAKPGTRPPCSKRSRTSSTIGMPRLSISIAKSTPRPRTSPFGGGRTAAF